MAYYSDFSYLSRAVMLTYLWIYLLFHIWQSDRFISLAFSRLRKFELKSVVTLMLLVFIPVQLYYDISLSSILYAEGFMDMGFPYSIRATPSELWVNSDREFAKSIDYVLMIGFSFQTGTLFLLQSFWNYLAGSVTKHSFMGSLEFKFYILWTVCTIIMFPALKFGFTCADKEELTTIVTELAYGISLLILSCLGVLSHFRFKKLIMMIKFDRNGTTTTNKLIYFSRINDFMTLALFISSFSFIILAGDYISPGMVIDLNKASADFLIFNATFCSMVVWFLVIKIVHCPYHLGADSRSSSDLNSLHKPRPSTFFTGSEPYSSSFNIETSDSPSRCTSRNFGLPTVPYFEYDQAIPLTSTISPIQRVANPRHSVVQPIKRPVSYKHYPVGRVEDPRRAISLYQYPVGVRRPSKQSEDPEQFV